MEKIYKSVARVCTDETIGRSKKTEENPEWNSRNIPEKFAKKNYKNLWEIAAVILVEFSLAIAIENLSWNC